MRGRNRVRVQTARLPPSRGVAQGVAYAIRFGDRSDASSVARVQHRQRTHRSSSGRAVSFDPARVHRRLPIGFSIGDGRAARDAADIDTGRFGNGSRVATRARTTVPCRHTYPCRRTRGRDILCSGSVFGDQSNAVLRHLIETRFIRFPLSALHGDGIVAFVP